MMNTWLFSSSLRNFSQVSISSSVISASSPSSTVTIYVKRVDNLRSEDSSLLHISVKTCWLILKWYPTDHLTNRRANRVVHKGENNPFKLPYFQPLQAKDSAKLTCSPILFLSLAANFAAARPSAPLDWLPRHTKMVSPASRTKVSPWLMLDQARGCTSLNIGTRPPATWNNLSQLVKEPTGSNGETTHSMHFIHASRLIICNCFGEILNANVC